MKKKLIIVITSIIVIIGILIGLYFYGLTPVSSSHNPVTFTISSGTNKIEIINNLKSAGLIKSKFSGYIYVLLNRHLNLQAGDYELRPNMSTKEILSRMDSGKVIEEQASTFSIQFIEGKRLPYYAEKIATYTNKTTDEVLDILSDTEYLEELISKYWFLTDDILNDQIYYPLEGYLFPNTYEFYNESDVKDIVKTMLDTLDTKLTPYKDDIEKKDLNIHEIITMASIVEVEGSTSKDRAGVAGVFYNRLKNNWSLGSDATTYYAAKVDFSDRDLYQSEIDAVNAYNTRVSAMAGKLPVGPICCPSIESLIATINPEEHTYYYFVADKNGQTYFTKTYNEHINKINSLKSSGLWYEYN